MNIFQHLQICQFSGNYGYKFSCSEFEEIVNKKIMNKQFEEFIVAKVLNKSQDHWLSCFEDPDNPLFLIARFICPKSATFSGDETSMKINAEIGNFNLSFKIFVGQNFESCQFMENENADDFINFVKFENSKQNSFSNYFEKTKEFKKVITVLVSNQKVGVQFLGASKYKEYSKNYDKIEFIEENNFQYVKNIGTRKRPRYTSDIQVNKRVSPKCKTCGQPTKGHKKGSCK
jgi:hypothetical protein